VPVEPQADLALVKRALADEAVPGKELGYELIVTNNGPSPARNVNVSDPLPSGLSFVSASDGCSHASRTVTCTVATLAAGKTVTFRVTTKVASSVRGRVVNTANVSSDVKDPDPRNNKDNGDVPPDPEADLSIDKLPAAGSVHVGEQLFYTLVVKNHGPSDADDVVVTDAPTTGLTALSAQSSQGSCSITGGKVTCKLGTLAAGGTAQVLVSARADAVGMLVNRARVGSSTKDPHPSNNDDEVKIPSSDAPKDPAADLEMVKTAKRSKNGTVTYTLRVTNLGRGTATGVKVVDTPNLPLKVKSVKTTQGSCKKSSPVTCSLGTLAPGAKATITIIATPGTAGTLRNIASTTADVPDPNDKNNIDGAGSRVRGKLTIKKTAGRSTMRAGGRLTYNIKVTNAGKIAVSAAKVCDRLPAGLFYTGSRPKASVHGARQCWTISRLAAGKSRTFTIAVRAGKGAFGRKVNTATVSARGVKTARARRAVVVTDPTAGVTG
jgi:uncharacterized repeat protein (TIGR01451 family)